MMQAIWNRGKGSPANPEPPRNFAGISSYGVLK
jgi:hypothetical protein